MSEAPELVAPVESEQLLADESLAPDISHLVTEVEMAMVNVFSSKNQRMFIGPLYVAQPFDRPFLAEADVAIYYTPNHLPIVPDMFLSLDVTVPDDWYDKRHRSYMIWEFGKAPDVVIEIVSNRDGGEDTTKMEIYARIGVRYYVIYDPTQQLSNYVLRVYELRGLHYVELDRFWLEGIGLGLVFWQGVFEQKEDRWLRWCDENDTPLPTGAEAERARAERLVEQLRKLGLEPEA